MKISIDEVVSLLGEKDVEIYALKKELAQTRAVLEQVTRGVEDGNAEDATNGKNDSGEEAGND